MTILNPSRRALLLSAAALAVCGPGVMRAATPVPDLGPKTGAKLPDLGMPQDQTGKPRSLASLMGEKGLVLAFFRSVVWCPYCQAQLMELQGGLKDIEQRGYKLVGLTYETSDVQKAFVERRKIGYTMIADPGSAIIGRFGLRDPQYPKGDFAYGVPRPIILFIDKQGVVKAKLYEETYTKRPPLTLVLETLDRLNKTSA